MTRKEEIDKAVVDAFHEAGIDKTSFRQGIEWADKTMLEKACKWLRSVIVIDETETCDLEWFVPFDNSEEMIEDFRKAMEE